jgi:hypothetical protein
MKVDPEEAINLVGKKERGLKRRTIEAEGSRKTIINWGGRIREYRKAQKI